ncbi:MAG: hypothetical protein HY049_13245 [Acidobacteria bacterium]|nr:hypothetical protein [Acidobacteriota bacterium]
MDLEFVPLLKTQREPYGVPRGMERFRAYLRTMVDARTGDLALPLVAMNPMAKDHIPALLDELLALDADGAAREAVAACAPAVRAVPGTYRVCLVVADDARGRWTNRYAAEFGHRIEGRALHKRGWIVGLVWSSERASATTARVTAATAIHRVAYILAHGEAATLGAMMAQEGAALARGGATEPALDAEDLATTRRVLAPHLAATDRATVMACLFGDPAAHALGYPAHGLSPWAGIALALHEARSERAGMDLPSMA